MAINIPIYAQFNDKGLKDAEGAFEKFGGKVAGIAKAAATAVAGIATAAGVGAYKAIGAGSDLAETQAKVGEIFGSTAGDIEAFASTAAKNIGQSKQSALDAAATFAIFGKAAGITGGDLVDFSADFTTLASDLASFNNTSPEEAVQAIGAALRGESEPLRRYGVMLNDAALKQEALNLGIYDGKGDLTQQQKILAAEAAIYKQTATAQGDFARTSDGLANQQRILKAQLANVTAEIGQKLLPIALTVANFFSEKIIPVIQAVSDAFSKDGLAGVFNLLKSKLPAFKSKLGEWAESFVEWIKVAGPKMLRAAGATIVAFATWMKTTGLPAIVDKLQEWGNALIDWIGPRIKPALAKLGELLAALANWILDTGLPLLVDKMIELGNALVDWIKPRIAPALKALGEFLIDVAEWIVTTAVPKLAEQALKLGGALLGWLKDLAPQALKGLASVFADLVRALPGLVVGLVNAMFDVGTKIGASILGGIKDGILAAAGFAADLGKAIVNSIVDAWNFVAKKINDFIPNSLGYGPFSINLPDNPIPNFPRLAEGGIVTKPTMALIGEAGPEAVIPLSKLGQTGGNTINVTVTSADPNQVVAAIQRWVRDNGAVPMTTTTAIRR